MNNNKSADSLNLRELAKYTTPTTELEMQLLNHIETAVDINDEAQTRLATIQTEVDIGHWHSQVESTLCLLDKYLKCESPEVMKELYKGLSNLESELLEARDQFYKTSENLDALLSA